MIEFPPFVLDTVNQCLRRRAAGADERILLPPRAFALLCYLVEHSGRLVTEAELLNAVWPKTYVQPEAIKSQLYEIRKILGDDSKAPRYIETLPRRGYRFIAPVRAGPSEDLLAPGKPVHGRLVGRDGTCAELWSCLRAAVRGRLQIVFVTGEPGIGKTALIDEFLRQASIEIPVLRVARGQCIEAYGGTEAYYPVLEALGQLCAGVESASIVDIMATQAPTWLVQFPALLTERHREILRQEVLGATRERMVRELGAALETITADTALLVVLEDLQWVDHSTVDLISALARRRGAAKLMLIATRRPIDETPSEQALMALKRELLLHKPCHEIDLKPLSEAEVAEYLAVESSQDSVPEGLAQLLYRHTEGNPLFVVAALDHLTQRGLISRENGPWQVKVPFEEINLGVPDRLSQLIEAQIERLSRQEQLALEAASVQGATFSVSLTSATLIGDGNEEDLETLYETLARRRRMVRPADTQQFPDGSISQRYGFAHAMYRDVLYRRQSSRRRATLHRYIGERLETLYSPQLGEAASELAYHFEAGADWLRAVKYLQLAARAASRRYARREAMALLQQALELSSKLPQAPRVENETAILERQATMWAVSLETMARANDSYDALIAHARLHGLIEVEVRALIGKVYAQQWLDSKRCVEVAERALRLSAEQPNLLLRARARTSCLYWRVWSGGWDARHAEEFERALADLRSEAGDDHAVYALDVLGLAMLQWISSRYRDAHRSAIEGLAIALEAGDENLHFNTAYQRASAALPNSLCFLGEWGEARRATKAGVALMDKHGDPLRAQAIQMYGAWPQLHAMDFAAVRAVCRTALLSFKDSAPGAFSRYVLIIAGQAETGLGNYERALEYLSAARDEIDNQTLVNTWFLRNPLESAITDFWLAKGDLGQARQQAQRFLEVALAAPEHTWQALAWKGNALVAMAEGDLRRAHECIAEALSAMEGLEVPLAAWRVHGTASELYELTGNKESASRHRELSRTTIRKLADSLLGEDEALRQTFLAAAPVAKILGTAVRT